MGNAILRALLSSLEPAVCVLLQGRVAGGLHWGHSLSSDSGGVTAAGNQEDSSGLFGGCRKRVSPKSLRRAPCFVQFMLLKVFQKKKNERGSLYNFVLQCRLRRCCNQILSDVKLTSA